MRPLREAHRQTYIDNTLLGMEVPPFLFDPAASSKEKTFEVVQYLEGIAYANNLEFHARGSQLFLRGADIPHIRKLDLGFTGEDFEETAKNLKWDQIALGGSTIVEVPAVHAPYLEELAAIDKQDYRLEFNLVTYSVDEVRKTGIELDTFLKLNVAYFEAFNVADFARLDRVFGQHVNGEAAAGISLETRRETLRSLLSSVTTTTIRGELGQKLRVALADEIPYQTTSTNQQGVEVRSNVEFVEAGFSVDVEGRMDRGETVFKFSLEDSAADFSRDVDGLPVIRRRVSQSIVRLAPGESQEITRIHSKSNLHAEKKERWFGPKDREHSEKIISVFVQRVDLNVVTEREAAPRAIPVKIPEETKPRRGLFRLFTRSRP